MSKNLGHALLALTVLAGCKQLPAQAPSIPPGAKYVAMGSSYAAGPGIAGYADPAPAPCFRSTENYAHQIARAKGLVLIDVGCSGGTTSHLLGPRDAIAPQLDALDEQTRLVTITIGGNDLGYIGRLSAGSCLELAKATGATGPACPRLPPKPGDQDYRDLATRMDRIAKEVRRRAPRARLVFVDYLTVLPSAGVCPATPLSAEETDTDRELARRLAVLTAKAALDNGADIFRASKLSEGHDACAVDPWMNGYPRPGAPIAGTSYHPNAKGMSAIAAGILSLLAK